VDMGKWDFFVAIKTPQFIEMTIDDDRDCHGMGRGV